jgi:hypothetical protein
VKSLSCLTCRLAVIAIAKTGVPASATVWVTGEDATLPCVAQTGHADDERVCMSSLALCACLRNFFLRSGRAGGGCAPGKGGRRREILATSGEQ